MMCAPSLSGAFGCFSSRMTSRTWLVQHLATILLTFKNFYEPEFVPWAYRAHVMVTGSAPELCSRVVVSSHVGAHMFDLPQPDRAENSVPKLKAGATRDRVYCTEVLCLSLPCRACLWSCGCAGLEWVSGPMWFLR